MRRNQADRRVIAARATRSTASHGTVATNPALRSQTIGLATGPVRRSTAVRLTATQRNSVGKRSEWNASMSYFTDPAWSLTVSHPVP